MSLETLLFLPFFTIKKFKRALFLNNQINSNGRYTKTFTLLLYIWMLKKGKTWALKNRYKTLSTSRKIFRPVEKNDDKKNSRMEFVVECSYAVNFLAHREMKFIFESYFFLHDFLLFYALECMWNVLFPFFYVITDDFSWLKLSLFPFIWGWRNCWFLNWIMNSFFFIWISYSHDFIIRRFMELFLLLNFNNLHN